MRLKKEDIKELDGFYMLSIETGDNLGLFAMTNEKDWNIIRNYKTLFPNTCIVYEREEISRLQVEPGIIEKNFDFVILNTDKDYLISSKEKLKNYVKKLAIEYKKNITGAYKYSDNSGDNNLFMFYATPSYINTEKIQLDSDVSFDNLMDIVSYKHKENNMELDYIKSYQKK